MAHEGLLIDLETSSSSPLPSQDDSYSYSYPDTSLIGFLDNADRSGTIYTRPSIEGNFYKRGVDTPLSLRSEQSTIVTRDATLTPKQKQKSHKIARRTWSDKIRAMYKDYLSASTFSVDPLTTETSGYAQFHESAAAESTPCYAECFSTPSNFRRPSGGGFGLLQVIGLNSPCTSSTSSPMFKPPVAEDCVSPLQNVELLCSRLNSTSCDGSVSSNDCPDLVAESTVENFDACSDDSDDTDTLGNFLSRMRQIPIPRCTNSTATLTQLTNSGAKSGRCKCLSSSYMPIKNESPAENTALELESMKAWTANLERKFNDMDTFEVKLKDRIEEVGSPLMPVSANLSTDRKSGSAKNEPKVHMQAKEPQDDAINLTSNLNKKAPRPERSHKAITWMKLRKDDVSRQGCHGPDNTSTKSVERGIKRIGILMKLNWRKRTQG